MAADARPDEAGAMDETTTPGPEEPPAGTTTTAPPPGPDWERVRDVPRLQRPTDRMVAGVCAGLGRHLAIDPLVLRVAFGVLAFFGGAGILLYGAVWLLLPEEGNERAPLHLDERSRGFALAGVAVLAGLALVGDSWGLYWFPWPLALLALVAWVLYDRSRVASTAAAPTPPTAPMATPGSAPAQAYAPAPTWTPARPRDPRRRGPVLFWFTLALVVLAMGVLGTVELAGVPVVASAYPALALALCATMLLVGAFWGRAGGIVALALVATVATVGALGVERWDTAGRLVEAVPASADDVRASYDLRRGELRLDLTEVDDLDALDGREVVLEAGAGRVLVVVPDELGVDVAAEVGGPGAIQLPDRPEAGGIAISSDASFGPEEAPRLDLRVELGVGQIEVVRR
ncbi:PspC domain-containing protein [Nocardioides sp. Y6]|uniref:PspC domain-containing protein n=1 Tax=Nocardioides malaquae TaxID=2773426 RepID=A0ABR9RTI2_9ACTN|nr:PspC domain-containing protein [Nocardioides malaquae]MBE7324895.1 PspC domain-containing protein [Nocardioides malaquae]